MVEKTEIGGVWNENSGALEVSRLRGTGIIIAK